LDLGLPEVYSAGISTEPGVMQNAAERLLGLKVDEIHEIAKNIIIEELRLIFTKTDFY